MSKPSKIKTENLGVSTNSWFLSKLGGRHRHKVASLVREMSDKYSSYHGIDRRAFLKTASGLAVVCLAMNKVFNDVFAVSMAEAADRDLANELAEARSKVSIFDNQTGHASSRQHFAPLSIPGNKPISSFEKYQRDTYFKLLFSDSDTSAAVLNDASPDDLMASVLTFAEMNSTRKSNEKFSQRLLSRITVNPNKSGWMDDVDLAIESIHPDSWTLAMIPGQNQVLHRIDDEKIVYPFYEKCLKSGITTVCVKQRMPNDCEVPLTKGATLFAGFRDLAKAAKDWPGISFVVARAGLALNLDCDNAIAKFETTGQISWTTVVVRCRSSGGLKNIYADLSTAFAHFALQDPRFAAALLGQLVNEMGSDAVLWGTDSIWLGGPQWQIEAFQRIEIPDNMLKTQKWKTNLGGPNSLLKKKILGQNAAALYKYKFVEMGKG